MPSSSLRDRVVDNASADLAVFSDTQFVNAILATTDTKYPLLSAVAATEWTAAETFKHWCEHSPAASLVAVYDSVCHQEYTHFSRVRQYSNSTPPEDAHPGPMHAYLRGLESPIQRLAGGFLGRCLISVRTHQALADRFHTECDQQSDISRLFETMHQETEAVLSTGLNELRQRCHTDSRYTTALMTAEYTIALAADDTRDALKHQQ